MSTDSNSNSYLTVGEVAARLCVSTDTVRRVFTGRKGVLHLGHGESRFKRKYVVLRIREAALRLFEAETSRAPNGVL